MRTNNLRVLSFRGHSHIDFSHALCRSDFIRWVGLIGLMPKRIP